MNFLISTVICTYNRKVLLSKTIDSVINQSLDNTKYEIIIVDNNSTDGTCELIKEKYKQHKNIRYLLETNQGISYSRNSGWQNSKAKYIAYIDDDEIADYYWLENLLNSIQEKDCNIGAVGGKIDPIWESKPPEWINDELSVYYSIVNISDKPVRTDLKETVLGGNVIYPKEVLYKMGGFDTKLKSRVGNSLVSSEDTLLHKRIMLSSYEIYYEPGAVVKHLVHSDRFTKDWLLKRFFWAGYSHAYIDNNLISEIQETSLFLHKIKIIFNKIYNLNLNFLLIFLSPILRKNSSFLYFCRMFHNVGYLYKTLQNK